MNGLKRVVFKLYISYYNNFPIEKGKYFLGKIIFNLFKYAIYVKDGIKLNLNPISLIDRKIIEGEEHDPEVKRMIDEQLRNGGDYIDIGANIGYFVSMAAAKKNVKVFAFEPSVRERERLEENIKLNNFKNVNVFSLALSDKPQTLKLSIARDWNPGLNSFVNNLKEEEVESIDVECKTFDSVFENEDLSKIKLIKIDVEGYELTVLKGMIKSMPSLNSAKFVIEITTKFLKMANCTKEDIYNFFSEYGFKGEKGMSEKAYDEIFYFED